MYSTESIVQDALDELQSISQKLSDFFLDWELDALLDLLEWRRWFYLWGRKWGDEQDVDWETAVCTVEETLHRHSLETPFLCLTLKEKLLWVDDSDERWEDDSEGWDDVLKDFLRRFIRSVQPGIEELGRMLGTDLTLQTRSSSRTDVKQLLDSVDFILHSLQSPESRSACTNETVTFTKNFIRFATLHGLEDRQIIGDLLTHFERVFIQSAVLLFDVCIGRRHLSSNSRLELMRKIEPVESRVCEIYVGVLQDVSKFSGSSFHPTKETHALVFRDFVDSLIFLILNLFFRDAIFVEMFPQEMHKVHEGLSFLKTTLSEHHDNLDDLIKPLICEAGILIFHLYQENGEQRGRLVAKLELLFSNFETKLQILKAAEEDAPRFPPTSAYPQTNLLGFIDSVLEKIKSFVIQVSSEKDKFRALHDDLTVLRSFVVHDNGMTIQDLSSRIATVAYDTEFVLDSLVVAGKPLRTSLIVQLDVIITEIELIKTQVSEIPWSMEPTIAVQKISQANLKMAPAVGKIPDSNERVVGLDDEAKIIIDRLTRGTKQLNVVSIVGMAGLGKTSLAKKVDHHSHISHHFQVRSWVTVSQEYNTKSLLIGILSGLDQNSTGAYINMREDDLAERLRKRLKGIRYLMILDDIWDTRVWNSLKMSFPDDDKGSRILLTSRQETIGLEINPHSEPHRLRALNDDESWELFRKKMCFDQSCPSEEVIARAKTIAKSCKGLPLMILIVAGFLANTEPSKWEEVEEMLKTGTAMAADQWMETLELSYRHLPNHLKPCFLYLGAFEEDESIPVHQILRLWIAEGFVQETAGRECLEDIAEGYMMELVQRNLVMVAGRDHRGQMQQCVLHDLLRDFAIARSKEEHFMHRLRGQELNGCLEASQRYRLTIDFSGAEKFSESRSLYPRLRTMLFVTEPKVYRLPTSLYKFFQFKLIRVLVLSRLFVFDTFPCVILLLVQLKYLAFTFNFDSEIIIPSSILNLSDLETLIVYNGKRVLLPDTLWGMQKLRHLDGAFEWILPSEIPVANLENLQTFSKVTFTCSQTMVGVVKKLPNLRTLGCRLDLGGGECTVDFSTFNQLESLYISTSRRPKFFQFRFPQNLKDLHLYKTCLPWSEVSAIGRLPNLEALRLDGNAYAGENWDIEEEGTFPKLRVLELWSMTSLERWTTASDDDFPSIETLILKRCLMLKEIPSCIAQSSTLQMIEVNHCPRVFDSVKEIHEMQMDYGNEDLRIYLDDQQLTKEVLRWRLTLETLILLQ